MKLKPSIFICCLGWVFAFLALWLAFTNIEMMNLQRWLIIGFFVLVAVFSGMIAYEPRKTKP